MALIEHTHDVRVRPGRFRREADLDVERAYVEHRNAVLAMLRSDFPLLSDPEELYQEAWAELLDRSRRSDEPVLNVRALLKKIAWRRAVDEVRRRRPDSVDPQSGVLLLAADGEPTPDEQVQSQVASATLLMAIEALDPREAAFIKLRFHEGLSSKEIQARLGVTPKHLEKIATSAYATVSTILQPEAGSEAALRRHQRSLLLACASGIASSRQRARAQEMLDADPVCCAMLRDMRRTLEDVAVVLPMPPVIALADRHDGRRIDVFVGWFGNLRAHARHLAGSATEKLPSGTGAADGAAAGGSALGAGVAAKVAVACLAAGGAAAICSVTLPRHEPHRDAPSAAVASPMPDRSEPARAVVPIAKVAAVPSAAVVKPRRRRTSAHRTRPAVRPEKPASSPTSLPAASPAPQGSTEFGVGGVGSSPAPTAPAVAPSNGGGEFAP